MAEFTNKLFLTFDVEDFINDRSLGALHRILKHLEQRRLKGIFFITGHMAEKLVHFPEIVELLDKQEIGYHSTSHSVHPSIFEYTDVDSYQEACDASLIREVAHINPLSGAIEGRGGIEALRDLFPGKKIEYFRAPGFSWSPPHLEALKQLGIRYDFSANISGVPARYKGLTFLPFPSFIDSVPLRSFLNSTLRRRVTLVDFHPNFFVNKNWWDSIFFSGNPKALRETTPRDAIQVRSLFDKFNSFLRITDLLSKFRAIEISGDVDDSVIELDPGKVNIEQVYDSIASWPIRRFNYRPRFIRSHLSCFFQRKGAS